MFFMRPKDREVVQVWAVWLGEFDSYMDVVSDEFRPAGDEVFEVYRFNHEAGINTLDIHGAFRVGSWDYNINETDGAGKPIGYGKPQTPLRKDFDYTFHGCYGLTSIPTGLFDNCTAVTDFSNAFEACTSLTSIPAGLFDNCLSAESFNSAFQNCISLTSIPVGLFDNCPNVASFSLAFANCTSLTSIPAGLFDNCTAVTDFSNAFYGCTSLAAIPAGLFDYCTAVTNFGYTFSGCTAITSAVPELWDTATWPNVTDHLECFRTCTNAANFADIPEGWK
jgi:hypothetical protein